MRLLLCGTSTRAAAESAARAGFQVAALDAYADLDQHPSVRALSVVRDFGLPPTAAGMARAARAIDADAVAYLSSLDNHPRLVATITAGRMLLGNAPAVLRAVRDPERVADTLRAHGFAAPRVRPSRGELRADGSHGWLVKPLRSGGGRRVRRLESGAPIPRGSYLQLSLIHI